MNRASEPFPRKSVVVLQHIGCEGLGGIASVLARSGVETRILDASRGQAAPHEMGDAFGLIVMGGPMGVYEEEAYPFLRDEVRLIRNAVAARKPVLGICLGSQLLAKALGARVYKGRQKEIGWHRVTLTEEGKRDALFAAAPAAFEALHWHGDVFDLPDGAAALASSDLTPVQAYRCGASAYGILFHLEIDRPMLGEWTKTFAAELNEEKIAPSSILDGSDRRLAALRAAGNGVFSRWTALL